MSALCTIIPGYQAPTGSLSTTAALALDAGPGGAAAGLALQGLLHEPLAEASQVSYTITGSWDDTTIEPVEVKRAGGNTID